MKRYHFLTTKEVYESLNLLRNAFLAAKNGEEVDEIINGLLTPDEKIKIGRRIAIEGFVKNDFKVRDIMQIARVGMSTILLVTKLSEEHPRCFQLINSRENKVKKEYEAKKYISLGGSKLIHKKKTYSGFKRKDVKR